MVGIAEFLSSPFFAKPLKAEPFETHWIAGAIYKIHSITGSLFFLGSCLVFVKEIIGDHIHCIQDASGEEGAPVPETAFNAYCYISTTFTFPPDDLVSRHPYPGVGPYHASDSEEIHHNYYQWVGYLLFLQSISFFAPSVIHKFLQDGRAQRVLGDLNNVIMYNETRVDKYGDIDVFFGDWYNHQNWWAIKLTMCHSLNAITVILNIFLVDWYLGGYFLNYGPVSLSYIFSNPDTRGHDPFDVVFPKMTKCTLRRFGPSGTVQTHDSLCIMTINVLNEKIFFLIWFVLVVLAIVTLTYSVVALIVVSYRHLREKVLLMYLPPEKTFLRRKLHRILSMSGYGDWMMLYLIARNTDRVIFSEVIDHLKPPDYRRDLEPLDDENMKLKKEDLDP